MAPSLSANAAQAPAFVPAQRSAAAANGSHAVPIVDPTAARRATDLVRVNAPNVTYTDDFIASSYKYTDTEVTVDNGVYNVQPKEVNYEFKTARKVPKTGLMLVGWGGNNGSTLTATILANKEHINWNTKEGLQTPNYIGSLVRASTVRLGTDPMTKKDVNVPFADMLPMVHPNDFVLGGWDISGATLDKAMHRAKVLEWDLQRQVAPLMSGLKPLPSVFYPDFINANQGERADNVLPGSDKQAHLDQIRKDIRDFKLNNDLEQIIVLWTANTERYADVVPGVNDTSDNIQAAVKNSHSEIAPSTIFAMASILEGVPYINGAPQPLPEGVIDMAIKHKAYIGGDDFKSGQTKMKSVLAEFLVGAGIKPLAIASYNHLGNNDGLNLNAQAQFRSKEISKSGVVDDIVASNPLLYKTVEKKNGVSEVEHPDHVIVIKYIPTVGDSKRAIDEYTSEILMGGRQTISMFNVCEDSLLATPLILDLAILAELFTRVTAMGPNGEPEPLHSVLSLLSYMLKAPMVKPSTEIINGLGRQRAALEHTLRALIGLSPLSELNMSKLGWE